MIAIVLPVAQRPIATRRREQQRAHGKQGRRPSIERRWLAREKPRHGHEGGAAHDPEAGHLAGFEIDAELREYGDDGHDQSQSAGELVSSTAPIQPLTAAASVIASVTAPKGATAIVTDATATTFNSIVAGGGSNCVPVFYDGSNWRIG